MQPLIWEHRPDGLRAPALICAFTGWNDAGDAASAGLQYLGASLQATRFARIDPEDFYDFQATRPKIKFVEGRTRSIEWPEVEVYAAHVPHSRPVPITGFSSDDALTQRLGLQQSGYEGPTGIVGVLHSACQEAGLPSASLWASVPHYVAAAPNPKAALALVRKLESLVGVSVDAEELEHSAADYERQVSLAVQSDPDVQAFVERLERAAAEEEQEMGPQDLPSGDVIAREFQRFLRQRGPGQSD